MQPFIGYLPSKFGPHSVLVAVIWLVSWEPPCISPLGSCTTVEPRREVGGTLINQRLESVFVRLNLTEREGAGPLERIIWRGTDGQSLEYCQFTFDGKEPSGGPSWVIS
ncbi:MAG: hypothetical protein C7B45_15815 [Sulfobacillus acidophilus]|uniref:Uncharacterized protein n=1 Tax=Sulfobacillus acidophilus TaxID=53633 RepID=A0A2T2WDD3_9FIRM|nr:MAG: hypothetical protein C7B45_15815 [Sulfobacillus acidophilus]